VNILLSVVSQIINSWLTSALLYLGAPAVSSQVFMLLFGTRFYSLGNWVPTFPSPFSSKDS
ncbi:unnamed protein product, partial (mitochondrion) [Musa textilis]